MTKQWEKYREIIIAEYKEENKPLHEVQRVMMERYGFRASSRFNRWGIHKNSRHRRIRSVSLGKGDSVSDGAVRTSPQQSLDIEETGSQAASPVDTPNGLLGSGVCVATPGVGYRRPAVAYSPALTLDPFGSGLATFSSQNIGCYLSSPTPSYRQGPRDVVIVLHLRARNAVFDALSRGLRLWRRIVRGKPRVLNYFPRYDSESTSDQFEGFCRVKLMLNHAHLSPDELKTVDGSVFGFKDPNLAGIVPIFRSKRDFLRGNTNCSRTQFPLAIAYAITVHKSQGATLDRAVLDISDKDFQPGLTYVAVSRVKTLQGIMFDTAFDLSALRVQASANHTARAEDIARRLPQHVTPEQVATMAIG
ncbi:hypothetical protein VTG60DRAFT_2813 [Thermothelomyces hinnuleus]